MKNKVVLRYSQAFKLQVVKELERLRQRRRVGYNTRAGLEVSGTLAALKMA